MLFICIWFERRKESEPRRDGAIGAELKSEVRNAANHSLFYAQSYGVEPAVGREMSTSTLR